MSVKCIKQQSIVSISAFTAKGDLLQLQKALNNGLDAGLTVNEIKEILVQLYGKDFASWLE